MPVALLKHVVTVPPSPTAPKAMVALDTVTAMTAITTIARSGLVSERPQHVPSCLHLSLLRSGTS